MFKSRPLFLIVITLCLLVVALASYWLALLPQRTLRILKAEVLETTGHRLEARKAKLNISNGFAVVLEDVSLENETSSSLSITAKSITVPGLFGGAIEVNHPLIDVDVTTLAAVPFQLAQSILIQDGTFKLRDTARKAVVAITDVNGEVLITSANVLQGRFALVWDSQVSDFEFSIEDNARFATSGSPLDFTLRSKNRLFGFSGQGRMENGLKLAGQTTLTSNELSTLFKWIGVRLQSLETVGGASLQSGFASDGLGISFDKLSGKIGTSDVQGNLTVEAGVDRPKLSGTLAFSNASLWGPKTTESDLHQPWSEKPFAVADLSALDINLAINVAAMTLRGQDLGSVAAQLKTDSDQLKVSLIEQPILGGTGSANFAFAKAGNGLRVESVATFKSVQAQNLFGAMMGFERLNGLFDFKANLKADGQSFAEVVSSLQGQVHMVAPAATVRTTNLSSLLAKPMDGWNTQTEAQTAGVNLDLAATLLEGVVTLGRSTLSFAGFTLKPQGEIDLLRQAVSIQLFPKGNTADPKMSMSGPWLQPRFSTEQVFKEKSIDTPPAN